MEITSIRNMDVQGRIVIPSEIRKHLNIEGGDALEIQSTGQDIRLRKCDAFQTYQQQFQTYLAILYDVIKHGVFICNAESVCAAKGIYLPDGTPIPEELSVYVRAGKETTFDSERPIHMLPHIKEPVNALFPVLRHEEPPLALVLFCRHQKPLTDMELGSAKLVAATLTHKLI